MNDLGSLALVRQLRTSRIAFSAILPMGAIPVPPPAEGGRDTTSEGTSSVSTGYAWRSISASWAVPGTAAIRLAVAGAIGTVPTEAVPPKLFVMVAAPLAIAGLLSIPASHPNSLLKLAYQLGSLHGQIESRAWGRQRRRADGLHGCLDLAF